MSTACDLAKEQKRNFGDDIALQLRTARKKRWNVQEERRICQEIELQSYLNKLINDDMEKRIGNIKLDDAKNEEAITKEVAEVEQECENHMTELNNLFAKIDDRRRVSSNANEAMRGIWMGDFIWANCPCSFIRRLSRNATFPITCAAKSALKYSRTRSSHRRASRTSAKTSKSICSASATSIR